MNCLMEPPVSPLGGARTSLDLQGNTRLYSRRLTSLLWVTTSARTSSGPPGWGRSTSSMTLSSAQEESMARTHAREMEEALLSAPLNMTLTPTYRLAWLPGVLAVGRMHPRSVRLCQ